MTARENNRQVCRHILLLTEPLIRLYEFCQSVTFVHSVVGISLSDIFSASPGGTAAASHRRSGLATLPSVGAVP